MSLASSEKTAPFLLTGPALMVFLGLVIIPLGMTVLLAFYDWGQYKGIVAEFTLKNFREIFSDSYFLEVFLRTLRISVLVTLFAILIGVPEAYILNRMSPAWRGLCLLAILGPLLVSVVARTLGWGSTRIFWLLTLPSLTRPLLTALAVGFSVSIAQYLPTLWLGAGRIPTLTSQAVALSSGGEAQTLAAQALWQLLLPAVCFTLTALLAWLAGRYRRGLR